VELRGLAVDVAGDDQLRQRRQVLDRSNPAQLRIAIDRRRQVVGRIYRSEARVVRIDRRDPSGRVGQELVARCRVGQPDDEVA